MTTPTDGDIRNLMSQAGKQLAAMQLNIGDGIESGTLPNVQDVRRRRSAVAAATSDAGFLTLVRDDRGVFDWQVDAGPSPTPQRRALRRGGLFETEPIDQVAFTPVAGSKAGEFLDKLDTGFNSRYGLFNLAGQRVDQVPTAGRVLLVVHGTFSKSEAITVPFTPVLAAARAAGYDAVLVFEHPTLAVSPLLNALDLARAFANSKAQVDIIAHSRGGLVVRWWLEVLQRERLATSRVVFFGAPLMGTALASPFRLRSALKLMTNVAVALQGTAQLVSLALPLFTVVQGLMALVASATSAVANSPLADAAVAMVPGLAAMSRYGPDSEQFILGNHELMKLSFGLTAPPAGYHMVQSNFEPTEVGWAFWRVFRDPKARLADAVTDALFAGANDLVVDTPSMSRLSSSVLMADASKLLDFKTSPSVHHLNYFHQADSAAFVRRVFGF